jgi:hypothetical protein
MTCRCKLTIWFQRGNLFIPLLQDVSLSAVGWNRDVEGVLIAMALMLMLTETSQEQR